MRAADVPYTKRKNTPEIRSWHGLNRTQGAADGEVIDCVGLSTKLWPAMCAADGRSRIGEWENATDVYETDGHMVVIDDNKLYYDGTFLSNVGGTKKQFAELGRKLVIWPDKIYINLNTGELGNIEANVSGNVIMRDGGILIVSGASGSGTLQLDLTYSWWEVPGQIMPEVEYQYWMRTYENLSYSSGWVYDSAETIEANNVGVGAYFIGSKPQTKYFSSEGDTAWDMGGTVFGKITKRTEVKVATGTQLVQGEDGLYYECGYGSNGVLLEYELYDADGIDLNTMFEAGDVVEVQGNALYYNDQDAVTLTGVGENQLVAEAAFVTKAYYYNVSTALGPGTYRLKTATSSGTVFQTERTIRAGEQLFKIAAAGDSGLDTTAVYAYDPKTKAMEAFASISASTYTDLDASGNVYDAQTENPLTISRRVPEMDYVCERDNRLYGVSNAEEETIYNELTGQYETVTSRVLHASALGQPTRWNVFEGAATDSYAVAVAGEGDFTGIVSYSGSVIAFKEHRMYKLTGDYPAEFYLRSYSVDGVKEGCHKSLAIINEVLYYLSPYGVMSYSGGVPSLISYNLDLLRYRDAVGGRDRTRYYISMTDPQSGYVLYSYDTVRGIWVIERKEQATGIERVGDYAYACIDGKIYKLADELSQEETTWMALLPETDEGSFEKKRYQYMALIAEVEGSVTVSCRQNDHEEWQTLGTITEQGKKIHRLPMDTIRCDRIQFKLEGEGKATIWAFERQFTVGSER